MTRRPRVVVAIPAKDEAQLLPLCLSGIARQSGVEMSGVAIVVACNNCSDDTADRARALAGDMPCALHVKEVALPAAIAHAGGARRYAMDAAAVLCGPDGVIITTDADGAPDTDWLAAYEAAFARGNDVVAGRVSTDWEELQRFPPAVLDVGAREWEYQGLCAELEALYDPEPHDPWPRHNQTCGANLAVTRAAYVAIGGLPVLRTGEDGAMVREVWRRDGRVRHDPGPHVTVSARLVGRAQGGMADALSQRHGDAYLCDDLLEPANDLMRRAQWRHAARKAFRSGELAAWARAAGMDPKAVYAACGRETFGEAWLTLEAAIPELFKRRLGVADLDGELALVRRLLVEIRPAVSLQAAVS